MSKHSWPGNCDLCIIFSPHRKKIWNNELITVKGKSLFFEKLLDHGLMYLSYLFDSSLRIYSYDSFFSTFNFTIKCKEFSVVTSQVTYVTMVPRVGNETLRPLGVATGNALSVTRSEDTYEKTPPVGRRQPMTSLPAYHNISAAGRIHHQLLRLKLASEAWLKAQGTQCLVPHSGNHGYIRNLRRSPSWELELRPLGVATGNVIPTSPC